MSGTTISGTYLTGITLSSPATQNPAAVAAGATIKSSSGTALAGASGTNWTVANNGTVSGAAIGISLASGGNISNSASGQITGYEGVIIKGGDGTVQNSGSVTGGLLGVELANGGYLDNAAGGSIVASRYGVILGIGATLVNSGSIHQSSTLTLSTLAGVVLSGDGAVTNTASGSITGTGTGVIIEGAGNVDNSGVISGSRNIGIYLQHGGMVTNAVSASITGGIYGVKIGGGAGTVENAGTVTGAQSGVYLKNGGSIINSSTSFGYIIGHIDGVKIAGAAGTVNNFSVIEGDVYGVDISSSSANVLNSGGITGDRSYTTGAGVYERAGGSVTNYTSGFIGGGRYGILISGDAGTVANHGSIQSLSGIKLADGGSITNFAPSPTIYGLGSIYGLEHGISITGAPGAVFNYGSISAYSASAVVLSDGDVFNDGTISSVQGAGIQLLGSGTITNAANAVINGELTGVDARGGGTVLNSGVIHGVVYLGNGGCLNNAVGGSIGGVNAFYAARATVTNAGTSGGINLRGGGLLTNNAYGRISYVKMGDYLSAGQVTALGTVVNDGILGSVSAINTSVTNESAGQMGAVILLDGGTLTNAGIIGSNAGVSVYFRASSFVAPPNNLLILDPGAVFDGAVEAALTAHNTLELAQGNGGVGALNGLGTNFIDFPTVIVDAGARWLLSGLNTLASGSTLTNDGNLSISGLLSGTGAVINNGELSLDAGTVKVESLSGTGTLTVNNGTRFEVQEGIGAGQKVGISGTLALDSPAQFQGTIAGFDPGDKIDLTNAAATGGHADMNYSTNVLTVAAGGNTYTFQFDQGENFTGDFFHLTPDQNGAGPGSIITEDSTPCYCRGTLIATEHGEVPVEAFAIGDEVMTASGASRPIKWIGRRSYGGRFILGRKDILPVCFKAGSIDHDIPRRDLWISPHHAMYLDGILIEAKDLINGVSIVQAEHVEEVEYFHIELDSHDVIIAEGTLSETFVDDDSRGMFRNAQEYALLYPETAPKLARYCAPRIDAGFEVEAIRRRLARRVGPISPAPQSGRLRGHVDLISARSIEGWAQNPDHPEAPVCLDICADGRLIGRTLANRYRADLKKAGLGSGRHAFVFRPVAGALPSPATVEVRRSLDGAPVGTTPPPGIWRVPFSQTGS